MGADVTLKIATVAPKGSAYHRVLQDMGEKWKAAEGPGARFIVYTDSAQGPEAETVRRMRVGQLQASMLSVVGLSEIDDSVSALQKIPLMFRSWDEVDHVREQMRPDLEQRLRAKGFVVLFWGEGGFVQFFSKAPYTMPEQYKAVMSAKSWDALSPAGRAALTRAAAEAGETLRAQRGTRDDEIIKAMEGRGLKVLAMTPEVERAWRDLAQASWPKVRGSMVPAEMFDRVERLLAEYHGGGK
ncbi:MAG: TRAP transporter substrate-binding protein DctP [Betaproteobacteria bacterium]|nr:TRAP transporter substrate-binding protein DctP [Betaproteobacteria bacterium]